MWPFLKDQVQMMMLLHTVDRHPCIVWALIFVCYAKLFVMEKRGWINRQGVKPPRFRDQIFLYVGIYISARFNSTENAAGLPSSQPNDN